MSPSSESESQLPFVTGSAAVGPRAAAGLSTPPFLTSAVRPKISVVIPALNEAENLPHVLPRIPAWVDEVLLVDGHSNDGTPEVARVFRRGIRIIREEPRGKGAALRAGFVASTGDIIIALDADGSTNPDEIAGFVGMLIAGADFVKGSRFLQGAGTLDMPLYRKLGNAALVTLTNILFGTRYTDITYGYNATWRQNIHVLALDIDGWPSEIISNIRAKRNGLHVVEVACFEQPRIAGIAKLRAFDAGLKILKAILRERLRPRTYISRDQPMHKMRTAQFLQILQKLYHEARELVSKHTEPDNEAHSQEISAIEIRYIELLAAPTDCAAERRLQTYYRHHYGNSFMSVLKLEDSAIANSHAGLEARELGG